MNLFQRVIGKENYEIGNFILNFIIYYTGFAKYSFEKIGKQNQDIAKHSIMTDITLRTRKIGQLSFKGEYKM